MFYGKYDLKGRCGGAGRSGNLAVYINVIIVCVCAYIHIHTCKDGIIHELNEM